MTSDTGYAFGLYKSNVSRKNTKIIATVDERLLSMVYQLKWIKGLQEQIDFANNPEVLSDFIVEFKVKWRSTSC
jgi:hypothetical protein